MMNQQRVRQILYGSMTVGAWSSLAQLYELIESSGALDNEDHEPSTPDGDEPKWRRNVRNVLQKDKETSRIDWNPESIEYRLNEFVVGLAYPRRVVTNKTQGGIGHSHDRRSVVCFTRPSDPNNLYSDGWMSEGYYRYEGTGRSGDQSFRGPVGHWNAKVRDHALTKQLFLMEGKDVKFLGYFHTDLEEAFNWTEASDENDTSRRVIQFHLWPAGNQPTLNLVVMNHSPETPEESSSQGHRVGGEYTINYPEALLVREYRTYLREQGVDSDKLRFPNPGGRDLPPLVNDIWVPTRKQLIEAKAEPTRENVRMVIGQIADYRRMAPQGCLVGALFNGCPNDDLLDLLKRQRIVGIWKEGDGGFADSQSGRFITG